MVDLEMEVSPQQFKYDGYQKGSPSRILMHLPQGNGRSRSRPQGDQGDEN
jgi:hypothetical protein